jgi:hypothetical protein
VHCRFNNRGERYRSVWGHEGSTGGLGLGKRGGGECEGAQQEALLVQEPKVGLLPNSLVLYKKNLVQPISLSFQSLQDKGERGLLQ